MAKLTNACLLYTLLSLFTTSPFVTGAAYQSKIRIDVLYQGTTNANFVITSVVDSAKLFFESLLQVDSSLANSISVSATKSCSQCDVLLIIQNSIATTSCTYPSTIFETTTGSINKEKERAATIDFCGLADSKVSDYVFKKLVDALIYGMMKVIAFHKTIFKYTSLGSLKLASASDYPKVVYAFNKKLLCSQSVLGSMPVETDGDYFLWHRQYAYQDIMTKGSLQDDLIWSFLNNGLLKDMTWFFSVNDSIIDSITLASNCPSTCTTQDVVFCSPSSTTYGCSVSRSAKAQCTALPTGDSSCRAFLPTSSGACYDSKQNQIQADYISEAGTYEYFGFDSKCFLSDIVASDPTGVKYTPPTKCYKYSCDSSNNITIYLDTSLTGNLAGTDTITCLTSQQGSKVQFKNTKYVSVSGLTCPANNQAFCNTKSRACPNFCSQQGVCANSACICLNGKYGDNCSCTGLQEEGKCVTSCSSKYKADPTTKICKLLCKVGYFYNSSSLRCEVCQSSCNTCWVSANQCESCASGYILLADRTCTKKTSSCPDSSTYYEVAVLSCLQCSTNCLTCYQTSTYCVSCPTGNFLSSTNSCIPCFTNCSACATLSKCTACVAGFFLEISGVSCLSACPSPFFGFQSKCLVECPLGFFPNNSMRSCDACNTSCETCFGSASNCLSCPYYATLDPINNTCINICPIGKLYSQDEQTSVRKQVKCVDCSSIANCATCVVTPNTCSSCVIGTYKSGTSCLSICPSGQFGDSVTGNCLTCDSTCSECINTSTTCTHCGVFLFLKNNLCLSSCGTGYIKNSQKKTCDVSTIITDEEETSSPVLALSKTFCMIALFCLFIIKAL